MEELWSPRSTQANEIFGLGWADVRWPMTCAISWSTSLSSSSSSVIATGAVGR